MKWFVWLVLLLTISWQQTPGSTATSTVVERAPLGQGMRCGVFATVATVPYGVLSVTDDPGVGDFCYRAYNVRTIDPGDGSKVTQPSSYSNVDATKPGNPKQLGIQ